MTRWAVHHGDIFDVQAEALICSANVFLTLSGGVGGELLRRYGNTMQERLNAYLNEHSLRHVPRGTVVAVDASGTPYRVILHAVAVDGMYESSPQVVAEVISRATALAAEHGATSAVLPALATGYGKLSMQACIQGIRHAAQQITDVACVTVAVRDSDTAGRLREAIADFV